MSSRTFAILLPLFVLAFAVLGIVAIGTLLLSVGEEGAIPVALALIFAITAGCAIFAWRGGGR